MPGKTRTHVRRIVVLVGAAVAVTAVAMSLAAGAVAAPPGPPPQQVIVLNTPLPVTGSVGVSGTVNVAGTVGISGTVPVSGDVGITGTPKVTSADKTTLAGSYVGAPDGGGAFTDAVDADVSGARSVRVMTNCFAGGACANITVRVYSIVGSRSYLIDQFPMRDFVVAGNVYDVLGENIAVQLLNNNAGPISNVGVAVYARANKGERVSRRDARAHTSSRVSPVDSPPGSALHRPTTGLTGESILAGHGLLSTVPANQDRARRDGQRQQVGAIDVVRSARREGHDRQTRNPQDRWPAGHRDVLHVGLEAGFVTR